MERIPAGIIVFFALLSIFGSDFEKACFARVTTRRMVRVYERPLTIDKSDVIRHVSTILSAIALSQRRIERATPGNKLSTI